MEYINYYPDLADNWSKTISSVSKLQPWAVERVSHSMNKSQLEGKLWLGTELYNIQPNGFKNAVVMGGWYCQFLAEILINNNKVDFMCNYDICEDSKTISYKFNKRFKASGQYLASTKNIFTMKLNENQAEMGDIDLVVNTSCEHMFNMERIKHRHFLDSDPLYVLQSTDEDKFDDHINCVASTDELIEQARLVDIKFAGKKILANGMTRFMVIGR
jgi:hypothetical protein